MNKFTILNDISTNVSSSPCQDRSESAHLHCKINETKRIKKTNSFLRTSKKRSTLRISSGVQACYNSHKSYSSSAMQLGKYFPKQSEFHWTSSSHCALQVQKMLSSELRFLEKNCCCQNSEQALEHSFWVNFFTK